MKNTRALVSLSIAAGALAIVVTGLLLYFVKHSNLTAAIHTSFGGIFVLAAVAHAINNLKPLKGYAYDRRAGKRGLPRREIYLTAIPATLLLAGLFYEIPGFSAVYDWGNGWRSRQENKDESRVVYQRIETNVAGKGLALEIDVRKGKTFSNPLFAVWVEDTAGHFLETLYVSKVIGTSLFDYGKKQPDGKWVPSIVRRPEALPYWGHQRGIPARDGYFLPDSDSPVPDAVTGATPNESFRLRTRAEGKLDTFRVYLEVNQSYDWNDTYGKRSFPDDAIYSGSGQVGQPSLVYAATIDPRPGAPRYYAMNPVGHGHRSGQDGKLDPDLSGMTTALEMLDGVMVKLAEP